MKILIIGGRGFVGSAIAKTLQEHDVTTFDRHPGPQKHFQGSILNQDDLDKASQDKHMVINCVGLTPLKQPKNGYEPVHVQGVHNIIWACEKNNIMNLIHISALGADPKASTGYHRTKGKAEILLITSDLTTVIIRPSLIIGEKNELVQMARKASLFGFFPHISAKVQPITIEDLSSLVKDQLDAVETKTIVAAGPQQLSIFEIVQKICRKKHRLCLPIPLFLVKIGMHLARILPLGISKDQITYLTMDNTADNFTKDASSFDEWLEEANI